MWLNKLRQHAAQEAQQDGEAEAVQLAGRGGQKLHCSIPLEGKPNTFQSTL